MGGKRERSWQSEFANNLKTMRQTTTVEEAVIQIVEDRLRILDPKPPIKLELVASRCGIIPEFHYEDMKQDARLVPHDGRHYIQVNKALYHRVGRQRFSVAHEIGHKILTLAKAVGLMECSNIGYATEDVEEEWLCDFAAKHILLLTSQYISPILLKNGLTTYTIYQIMLDFGVSFEAASRALMEITADPATVLYCAPFHHSRTQTRLQIVRYYSSDTFPDILSYGDTISPDSIITRSFLNNHAHQHTETWSINGQVYNLDVTTVPRKIYIKGMLQDGIIALVKTDMQ